MQFITNNATHHFLKKITLKQPMYLTISFVVACSISLFFISLKATAQAQKTILVAMHIEPPFSEIINGEFVGENIDLANALANQAGYNARFVYCPIARCFSLIQSGQADMFVAVRKTELRKQFLTYIEPPIKIQKLPLRFYIRTENKITLNSYKDLRPLTVGVLRGASYFDKFDHDTQIKKIPLTNHQQLIDMLLKGRIDTFLEREESIMPLVDQNVYATRIKLAKFSYDKSVGSYIAISKNSNLEHEKEHFSNAFQTLSNSGELMEILNKTRR